MFTVDVQKRFFQHVDLWIWRNGRDNTTIVSLTRLGFHGNNAHLIQTLHIIWLDPVLSNRGIPSVSREIVNEILEEFSELFLCVLNIDVRAPDNEVGLRGCLANYPRRGGVTRLDDDGDIQLTNIHVHGPLLPTEYLACHFMNNSLGKHSLTGGSVGFKLTS